MPRKPPRPARQRLSPELRKTILLRAAAEIIAREGITAVSMQRVAEEAGVSKGLVYNYFPTCHELLYELLRRETATIHQKQVEAARGVTDFVELTRGVTRVYLRHVAEHGELLRPLMAEPTLTAELAKEHRIGRPRAVRLFAQLMVDQYGVPMNDAQAASDLLMDLSGAAARRMQETGESPDYLEDLCVQLVVAGVTALAKGVERSTPAIAREGKARTRTGVTRRRGRAVPGKATTVSGVKRKRRA